MLKRTKKRLITFCIMASIIILGVIIILTALKDSIIFFYTPSELLTKKPEDKYIRIGGMVKKGSFNAQSNNYKFFIITDYNQEIKVKYQGSLPALFREGQGIVVSGYLKNSDIDVFTADEVLAKHDEKYMPRELSKSLKKQGASG